MRRYEDVPDEHVRVYGRVVAGHGVASGRAEDPRFPYGTLALQWPLFEAEGIPLDGLHRGTVNVSTGPITIEFTAPWWTVEATWHPEVPTETFSFVPCQVRVGNSPVMDGLVYRPHPETKPDHHQPDDVIEVLIPHRPEVHEDAVVRLDLPSSQVAVVRPDAPGQSGDVGG